MPRLARVMTSAVAAAVLLAASGCMIYIGGHKGPCCDRRQGHHQMAGHRGRHGADCDGDGCDVPAPDAAMSDADAPDAPDQDAAGH